MNLPPKLRLACDLCGEEITFAGFGEDETARELHLAVQLGKFLLGHRHGHGRRSWQVNALLFAETLDVRGELGDRPSPAEKPTPAEEIVTPAKTST